MTTISVSSASQLSSALASAHAGDVISLSAGNYGDVSISGKTFASDLTITSADPAHAAMIRSLDVENSAGIHLNNLNVNFTPTAATMSYTSAVTINGSHGITITGGVMTGGVALNGVAQTATAQDATGNVIGLATGRAITIQNSSGVKVSGTNISHFDRGVILVDSTATTLDGNNIHDLRRTAIAGTGNNLTIENNNLHDAHPWKFGDTASQGDHADFIALWTDAGQTTASDNIVIRGNIMAQGAGTPILGMWMQGNTAGFTNVTISGNAIEIGNNQGIALKDVSGGSITNNTLIEPVGATQAPIIILQAGASNIAVSGNLVSSVSYENAAATTNTVHGNLALQSTSQIGAGHYDATLLSKLVGLTDAHAIYNTVVANISQTSATVNGVVVALQVVIGSTQAVLDESTTNYNLTEIGDSRANVLIAGSGNDTLDGHGGGDTLVGGSGNDTFIVPNSLAKIVEPLHHGISTVIASGDYSLGSGLDNLTLAGTNSWSATGNDRNNAITGNTGNNHLYGGAGNDTLDGGGGNDTLTGGAGADQFNFSHGRGSDVVTDFSYADGDRVHVADSHYTVTQVGADTVLNLGAGDQMVLQHVTLATLHSDWILVG